MSNNEKSQDNKDEFFSNIEKMVLWRDLVIDIFTSMPISGFQLLINSFNTLEEQRHIKHLLEEILTTKLVQKNNTNIRDKLTNILNIKQSLPFLPFKLTAESYYSHVYRQAKTSINWYDLDTDQKNKYKTELETAISKYDNILLEYRTYECKDQIVLFCNALPFVKDIVFCKLDKITDIICNSFEDIDILIKEEIKDRNKPVSEWPDLYNFLDGNNTLETIFKLFITDNDYSDYHPIPKDILINIYISKIYPTSPKQHHNIIVKIEDF
jgi:hypothetical protein